MSKVSAVRRAKQSQEEDRANCNWRTGMSMPAIPAIDNCRLLSLSMQFLEVLEAYVFKKLNFFIKN